MATVPVTAPTIFTKLHTAAFKQVSNAPLVYLRVLVGFIMFLEGFHSLVTGWVRDVYIHTNFTFTFIGFEWLQFLHGPIMYWYYAGISLLGLMVCTGLFYRVSATLLALMWTSVYLLQKTHYNNHFYLMVLLCWMMVFVPANRRFSLDGKRGAVAETDYCDAWCIFIFQFQVACVFVYAAIAKLYPDWLKAIPLKIWLSNKGDIPVIGPYLKLNWVPYALAYLGILFDLLIVPGLLWKKTRQLAFIAALTFNALNATIFHIGTFPFLALGLAVIFYPPSFFETFVPNARKADITFIPAKHSKTIITILGIYIVVQIILPLRHHMIPGNVFWTEEGHRLSWRMMLRTKRGNASFIIKDAATGKYWTEDISKHLTPDQAHGLAAHPDMCWQFAQYLHDIYKDKGQPVQVHAYATVSLNGRPERHIIDTNVNLATVKWKHLGGNKWITFYIDRY